MLRITQKAPALLGLLALLFVLPGCPLSPDSDDGGGDPGETRLPERNTVDEAIEFYRVVWEQRLYENYQEVLHENFEFYPLILDAEDFPWLGGAESWGRTIELAIAANMFNPEFEDTVTETGETARRVERITMALTKRSERPGQSGVVIVTHEVDAYVWFNSNDASHTNAVFEFEVVQGPGGKWQILSQREKELL
jgi:hypothetical protein